MISKKSPSQTRTPPPRTNLRRAAPRRAVQIALITATAALLAASCAPRSAKLPIPDRVPTASPVTGRVNADWDDLLPALDAALSRCSMATETIRLRESPAPDAPLIAAINADTAADYARVEADLVMLGGVTGSFTAVRTGDHIHKTDIDLTCRIGTAGDPALEACLVQAITQRLRQLRGVQVAPLRWP